MRTFLLIAALVAFFGTSQAKGPFFLAVDNTTHIIGNDIWNVTIGYTYGKPMYYKNKELVGAAVGHYASYNGAVGNINWTSAAIHQQTPQYLDVVFTANEGDFHWVIFPTLAGAYQYFINRALPILGEFRTLWRLDNTTFLNGKTDIKEGPLPTLAQIDAATKVQDETWLQADGTYITKYDWADFIRNPAYYGVYGEEFGSWYVDVGKDDYNGDQLKQELMVHRESSTGDTVQLNMIHGTHFMASSSDAFAVGRTWGPWLWYLNDGSFQDVAARAAAETKLYPYSWFDNAAYQSRGSVSGTILLADGTPAAGAYVHLGDNHPNETTLDQGRYHYYTSTTDCHGTFHIPRVRTSVYALHAWPSPGSSLTNITTVFLQNNITVAQNRDSALGKLVWTPQARSVKGQIFQLGDLDRTSLGFQYGGAPHQHALVAKCPANLTYTIGTSVLEDWCYGQSALGTWTIAFDVPAAKAGAAAVLSVSLAGYSSGVDSVILVNGAQVGNLSSAYIASDPCMYRSATTAGEWHYFEFGVPAGKLVEGTNEVGFEVTRTTLWHGFMWDSVLLEWA